MAESHIPATSSSLQTELLMDSVETIDEELLVYLERLGQPRRSPDVLDMETKASRARLESVAPLRPLIEMYCRLWAEGMYQLTSEEAADIGEVAEVWDQLVTQIVSHMNAVSVAIVANLIDKGVITHAPRRARR
ncbi:hypothetical protein [Streptomyces sp. UNOC14_S4]|uniref:hypothetical protein n=1 Tax=Streptomyces sp. UNOC14_S4 TaxID=2872340 RepID=UPI001E2D47DE|nr:hypothetical protein [Streptomyces sp. UNOC14_S4]MCC3766023.1 hypothetical protein [Streptomyces sp. UNOC14_S4]